jgi:hypothetical protein
LNEYYDWEFKMRSSIQIIAGLALISLTVATAHARGGNCPAFNTGMVDSAFLATEFNQEEPVEGFAVDHSDLPFLFCEFVNEDGGYFAVFVGYNYKEPAGNKLHLYARSPRVRNTLLRTYLYHVSDAELRACRAQVVASFVWKRYCLPLMQ